MYKALSRIAFITLITLSQASACQFVDTRVCDIDAKLQAATGGHIVKYVVDFPDSVAEQEWVIGAPDIIHLGDTSDLSYDDLYFAIAHEFGHSVLHHGRMFVESFAPASAKSMTDSELLRAYGAAARANTGSIEVNFRREYEADAFASKILAKDGVDFVKALRRLLAHHYSDSDTHPGKSKRIEKAKEAVAALNT